MNTRRVLTAFVLLFVVPPLLMLPFRGQILSSMSFSPPLWSVPGMVAMSIVLFAGWWWLWSNRPQGVFGR